MAQTTLKRLLSYVALRAEGDVGPFTCYHSHRRRLVVYQARPRAKPPTPWQQSQLDRLRIAALGWWLIGESIRHQYRLAARRGRLRMSGYALWIASQLKPRPEALRTLERQTNTSLKTS